MLIALESSPETSSDSVSVQEELEQPKSEPIFPEAELSIAGESAIVADWSQVSFADFPPLEGRNTRIEDELTLGDLAFSLDIEALTFDSILKQSREYIESPKLSDYGFIADMQVSDLTAAIRGLETFPIHELRPIYDLLKTMVETPVIPANATLSDVLALYPNLGSVRLKYLNLETYQATEIPGFVDLPVISIPNWAEISVSAVPGLKAVPLKDIGDGFNLSGQIVSVGIVDSSSDIESVVLHKGEWKREWNKESPLTPFGSLMEIVPTRIEDTLIETGIYFSLCQVKSCRKIGPFSYLSYAERDRLFAGDISIETVEQEFLSVKRESVVQTVPVADPAFSNQMLEKALLPLIGALLALGALLWLLLRQRKRRQR